MGRRPRGTPGAAVNRCDENVTRMVARSEREGKAAAFEAYWLTAA